MKTYLIAAAAATSLLAGTALAQTSNSDMKPAPAPMMQKGPAIQTNDARPTQADSAKGIAMAKSASLAVRFVTPKPADIMTSKLVGLTVYNKQNDKLGEIEDLSIENGKSITGVVVSVGGFLGMGERYVVIDPATIVVNEDNGTWKAYVDTSKDTLKGAPEFHYAQTKS